MNEIDEIVFTLTERLNDEMKISQRNEYNQKIRKIYLDHLENYEQQIRQEATSFFQNLILLSGCEEPQKMYRVLIQYLDQAFQKNDDNNNNFNFENVTSQTNTMNIYKWYKNILIENIHLESKLADLKLKLDSLSSEEDLYLSEEKRQEELKLKNVRQEQCIKRGEFIRGKLYLLIDDINRDMANKSNKQ